MFVSIDGNISRDMRYNILVFERAYLLENEAMCQNENKITHICCTVSVNLGFSLCLR